jgi:hypothetical protein
MFKFLEELFTFTSKDVKENLDPIEICEVYKVKGCSYANGTSCKPGSCSIRNEFKHILLHQERAYKK